MVSSASVGADASSFSSNLSEYKNETSNISSWQGDSFDSFMRQVQAFFEDYSSTIEGQLDAFQEAVSYYDEYEKKKRYYAQAETGYRNANTNNNEKDAASFYRDMVYFQNEMTTLENNIRSCLRSISRRLEATSLSELASSNPVIFPYRSSSKLASDEFVNYYQYNYSGSYGGGSIANWGCGPTALAMVLTYLNDEEISPIETCAVGNGAYTCSEGTLWSFFPDVADMYGVHGDQIDATRENIVSNLQAGNPIILNMGPGDFTNGGHFIVLRGFDEDGKVIVSDPASENRSNTTWDIDLLVSQTNGGMWAFYS